MHSDMPTPGFLFHSVHRARHAAIQAELFARGLQDLGSPMILFYLVHRRAEASFTQRELADALRVSPATVAMSLKSLQRAGYVQRSTDPGDARRNRISITEAGKDVTATCMDIFRSVDREMFCGFSPGEIDQIAAFHHRMLHNLRRDGPCRGADFPKEGGGGPSC